MHNPRARGLRTAAAVQQLTAEYIFGIFGGQTWGIYEGPRFIGLVYVHSQYNVARFTAGDAYLPAYDVLQTASVTSWRHWLYEHSRPPGQHETAF